jgi:hypothetical protein
MLCWACLLFLFFHSPCPSFYNDNF